MILHPSIRPLEINGFEIKRKTNGSINQSKAHLMVKGYTQRKDIYYEETFFLVVRFASIRLIPTIVAHLNLELFQIDAKTIFLNGKLDEEIIWINLFILRLSDKSAKYVISSIPFMA